jgi:hypothetical protein
MREIDEAVVGTPGTVCKSRAGKHVVDGPCTVIRDDFTIDWPTIALVFYFIQPSLEKGPAFLPLKVVTTFATK